MIRPALATPTVYLCVMPVDFRNQINGLSAMVENDLELDPFADAIYVFTNKRRNQCRLLTWERNGFVLWTKRLEKGHFHWPKHDADQYPLTAQELNFLLDGYDLSKWQPHASLHYTAVS